jgi:hypothetical protein
VAEVAYNVGKARLLAGAVVAGTANLAAAVVITSKTGASDPDLATLAAIDAVGTVALHTERKTLTGVTVTTDLTNDRVALDSADISFAAAAGVTALALIIYDKTTDTSDTTRIPLFFYDTGFPQPMDGGLNVAVSDFARVS